MFQKYGHRAELKAGSSVDMPISSEFPFRYSGVLRNAHRLYARAHSTVYYW